MKPKRSLVTILFTDIVGSTKRVAELRDAGWRDVRHEHDRRVRRELRRFGGREINTAGDSFLATFSSPARAIACAGAIRSAMLDLGLEVRAGLHMGELEREGHDLGGLGVHIGARVAAEAGPREILVSRSVHDALAGSVFDFEDRGVRALKGVPGEWRLFAVSAIPEEAASETVPRWLAWIPPGRRQTVLTVTLAAVLLLVTGLYLARRDSPAELTAEQALAINAAPGIAVLPFTVQGRDLDVWREGMVDVLSTNLDGAAGLRAIDSRTVLARWREGVADHGSPDLASALEIARQTGARYALIGDVVGVSTGVRFGAEIYDLEDGSKLGRGQVEGSPDSIFSLVDRLSIEVLRAIYREGRPDLPEMPALESVTTASLPALKSYLSGEVLYRGGDFPGAAAAYERAIASDSLFALAIMRVGDAAGWISYESPIEHYERALKLSRLPARETLLAQANLDILRGTSRSVDSLRLAVQRYPDDPEFWYLLGDTYYHLSNRLATEDETDRMFSRALALDPYFAHYYLHSMDIALHRADSVRTATLLQAYVRIAPEDEENVWIHTVAFSLAFGDSAHRNGALQALDTLPIMPAIGLITVLSHPQFGRIQEQAYQRILARPDEPPDNWLYYFLTLNLLERGRFRATLGYLEDVPQDPLFSMQSFFAYLLSESGMTLPRQVVERHMSGVGNPDERNALFAGVLAVDQGRWPAHAYAVRLLYDKAEQLRASGDSSGYDFVADEVKALEAYGRWKRGHRTEALAILQEIGHLGMLPNWWSGKLALELGMKSEAVVYFTSIWGDDVPLKPLAAFYLGGIYNDLGEFEKSRQSYEYALLAWHDADPEMRPRIEAARQALARLPKLLRRESQ